MESSVSAQLSLLGQSVLLGAAGAIAYELLRPLRRRRPKALWLWDGLFCLCAGLCIFLFLLRRASGQLRLYHLLAALLGAGLFSRLFSAALRPVWEFWCATLFWTLRVLALPGRWLLRMCKKTASGSKNLFYFAQKCATMKWIGNSRGSVFTKEAETMAKKAAAAAGTKRTKLGAGVFTRVVVLALLAALGWQLYCLRQKVDAAQTQKSRLSAQVEEQQQANDQLQERIDQGGSQEEMEEIARDELGLVSPGERVFHDISN